MAIADICTRNVVSAPRDTTVRAAARLMRERHVGTIVVGDATASGRTAQGIVTDRDIVVAVVALDLDAEVMQIGDIMATELISLQQDSGIAEAVDSMRRKGVRRIILTDARGDLVGIVSADDVLSLLAGEISALAAVVNREQKREAGLRYVSI